MSATINFINDLAYAMNEQQLQHAVDTVLRVEGVEESCELSVMLVENDTIRDYNRQYRQVDAPTDVLSFPTESPPIIDSDELKYLGDLLIAYPYTQAQAEREGYSLDDMLVLLVVHGTLHLFGHDHDTVEKKAAMWESQARILQLVGVSPTIAEV